MYGVNNMKEKEYQKNEDIEIDLGRVFRAVVNKTWLVALVALLCAALTFAGTFFLITPKYEASAMFYVNNNNFSLGEATVSLSSGDLPADINHLKIVYLSDIHAGFGLTDWDLQRLVTADGIGLAVAQGKGTRLPIHGPFGIEGQFFAAVRCGGGAPIGKDHVPPPST